MINSSVGTLTPKQQRILRLYSGNYKPCQIAAMESDSGTPTTSRQVTVALYEAWPKLSAQFKKNGVTPTIVPMPLWLRIRQKAVWFNNQLCELANAVGPVAVSSLIAISIGVLPEGPGPAPLGAKPDRNPVLSSVLKPSATTQQPEDPEPEGPRSAGAVAKRDRRATASIDVEGEHHEINNWEDNNPGPTPSLQDQIVAIVQDPSQMLPTCGGLPVCN